MIATLLRRATYKFYTIVIHKAGNPASRRHFNNIDQIEQKYVDWALDWDES